MITDRDARKLQHGQVIEVHIDSAGEEKIWDKWWFMRNLPAIDKIVATKPGRGLVQFSYKEVRLC